MSFLARVFHGCFVLFLCVFMYWYHGMVKNSTDTDKLIGLAALIVVVTIGYFIYREDPKSPKS